jgi:antitoxin component YwqK of YwqJK toxin-antitoxin module
MEMATLEQQAPGRNRLLFAVLMLCCLSCNIDQNKTEVYYDTSRINIRTQGGVTFVNNTPITGVLFSLNTNGDTTSIVSYVAGKEHGWSKFFYDNHKRKALRYYVHGWKEGEHFGWYENGKPQFIYHFKEDKFDGNQKEWLSNGQIYSDQNYDAGFESGSQKVWYTDGTVKSNYVIINNKRYGLLGTKNCVNTVDSIFVR